MLSCSLLHSHSVHLIYTAGYVVVFFFVSIDIDVHIYLYLCLPYVLYDQALVKWDR